MLLDVICFSGLKPQPSYVLRYISQSPASGCCSRSSVTVGYGADPTCAPCAATGAMGTESHNVKYDTACNLISCLPFSMEQRRFEKAGKVTRPSSQDRRRSPAGPHGPMPSCRSGQSTSG